MRPFIIPVFIPHRGCPHRCIFCDQEKITSQEARSVTGSTVKDIIEVALKSPKFHKKSFSQVAFYGGTFTRLPEGDMTRLLEAVAPFIQEGLISSIRVSTRPDALDMKRLEIMKRFFVDTVELGVQSMDQEVLSLSRRGYSVQDSIDAVQTLKGMGFRVGVQMMPGLPGDSENRFHDSISKIIDLNPSMARLYPALVIDGTELADLYRAKRYRPFSLEDAVRICGHACKRLEEKGIAVIRMGLMSSPSLLEEGRILAGPWHPAFGFLVRSFLFHQLITPELIKKRRTQRIKIFVNQRDEPLLRGHKNQGIQCIEEKTAARVLGIVPDDTLPGGRIRVESL
jgi:histone acetyltransferase (RNA polymerase elongator complex component)